MNEQDIYTIGEASLVTGLPKKTLRYYDSIQLVIPAIRNPANNYRGYTKEQIVLLFMVKRLRKMECSIEEIREIIKNDDINTLLSKIEARMETLKEEIAYRQQIIDDSREFIERLKTAAGIRQQEKENPDEFNNYLFTNIGIEEIPRSKIFSIRRLMPDYNINDTSINFWSELYGKCIESGFSGSGTAIATYHNNLLEQFIMKDCDLELSIRIGCVDTVTDDPHVRIFGGFTAATAIYVGSYDNMIGTYLSLLQWINRNGYEANGVASEEFIISPAESSNQQNQMIKIIIPVKKK